MSSVLICNGLLVNEGRITASDIFIKNGRIEKIAPDLSRQSADRIINADEHHVFPGIIDDQVHFREPGLTHKATIASESRAAVAGGVTTYMEMPNTVPPTLTNRLLEDKFTIAAHTSAANYSFFLGASNSNIAEIKAADPRRIAGIKAFLGSSTGNLLVDDPQALEALFTEAPCLVAIHAEDEQTIKNNMEAAKKEYGSHIPPGMHPVIRSAEACFLSSSNAVRLARQFNTRLHVLHISTAEETALFTNSVPLAQKRITAEVCVHHLHFSALDYAALGNQIKCNPAIKDPEHRAALWQALSDNRLDIIATDHAPHAWAEKQEQYLSAPSGLPLVQHSLLLMLQARSEGKITLERIAEKMCHAPADLFNVADRGYLREGYFADIVLINLNKPTRISKQNLLYKCGWSPLEGLSLPGTITHTLVSGEIAYENGLINPHCHGKRVEFDR